MKRGAIAVVVVLVGLVIYAAAAHEAKVHASERAYEREQERSATATTATLSTSTTVTLQARLSEEQWEELGRQTGDVFLLWHPQEGPEPLIAGINSVCQARQACVERQGTELLGQSKEAAESVEAARRTVTRACRHALGDLYAAMYNYGLVAGELAHGASLNSLAILATIKEIDETVVESDILNSEVTGGSAADVLFGPHLAPCKPS